MAPETLSTSSVLSDRDKVIALLNEMGIGLRQEKTSVGWTVVCEPGLLNTVGVNGVTCEFNFDHTGKFKQLGCWELALPCG